MYRSPHHAAQARLRALFLAGLVTSLPACHAPLVQAAGYSQLNLEGFAARTEAVTLDSGGVSLEGVFTPAAPDVPRRGIAVHFLPAGSSVTSGLRGGLAGMKETLLSYSRLGWASLVVDYRGVGASGGSCVPEQFAKDAGVVWAEALRRRRSDELLVLRGVSLGSLPIAALLADDVLVDGVILHAPVRSSSVIGHEASFQYGELLGSLFELFLRDPRVPDILDCLDSGPRLLVVLPEHDRFISSSELKRLRERAQGARHEIVRISQHDHTDLVLRAFGFETKEFSVKQLHRLPEEEARFLAQVQ